VITAFSAAPLAFASESNSQSTYNLTGLVVSQSNRPLQSIILRNHSTQALTVEKFDNGRLMFDGEVVDCNGACLDQTVTLAPGEERMIQFDKRRLFDSNTNKGSLINAQTVVHRLTAGTRVVPFKANVSDGVAVL